MVPVVGRWNHILGLQDILLVSPFGNLKQKHRAWDWIDLQASIARHPSEFAQKCHWISLNIFQLVWNSEDKNDPTILNHPHPISQSKWFINRESPEITRLSLQSPSGRFLFVPPHPQMEDWGNCKANLFLTLKRDEAGETQVLVRKNLYGTYRRVPRTSDCWSHGSLIGSTFELMSWRRNHTRSTINVAVAVKLDN